MQACRNQPSASQTTCSSELAGGLLTQRLLDPTPRVSDSVVLGWGLRFAFLISYQMMLMRTTDFGQPLDVTDEETEAQQLIKAHTQGLTMVTGSSQTRTEIPDS